MKYVLKLSAILLAICLFACKSSEADKELSVMHDQVMEIHDEVMPKMRDINKFKKDLSKNFADDKNAQKIVEQLDAADESMMEWMHQFDKPSYEDTDAAKKYYSGQLEKVSKVKKDMLNSIDRAKEYIGKHGEK